MYGVQALKKYEGVVIMNHVARNAIKLQSMKLYDYMFGLVWKSYRLLFAISGKMHR